MSIILVCEIEIDLGGQKLVVNAAQTFINKIASKLDHYIILISKEGVQLLFKWLNSNLYCL